VGAVTTPRLRGAYEPPEPGAAVLVGGIARVIEHIVIDGQPGYRVTVETPAEGWADVAKRDGWDGLTDDALINAAIDGIAWTLLDHTSDTSDRGVSPASLNDARATARRILGEAPEPTPEMRTHPDTTTPTPRAAVCGKPYTDRHGDPDTCSFPPNHDGSCW
jgi:hypothetical protein